MNECTLSYQLFQNSKDLLSSSFNQGSYQQELSCSSWVVVARTVLLTLPFIQYPTGFEQAHTMHLHLSSNLLSPRNGSSASFKHADHELLFLGSTANKVQFNFSGVQIEICMPPRLNLFKNRDIPKLSRL